MEGDHGIDITVPILHPDLRICAFSRIMIVEVDRTWKNHELWDKVVITEARMVKSSLSTKIPQITWICIGT